MQRFTIESDPEDRKYDDWAWPRDHDLDTAQFWTLHLRVDPAKVDATIEHIMRSGAEILTGDYCGGDSFAEWCEPMEGSDWYAAHGAAAHVYFSAPTPESASERGRALATLVGIDSAVN